MKMPALILLFCLLFSVTAKANQLCKECSDRCPCHQVTLKNYTDLVLNVKQLNPEKADEDPQHPASCNILGSYSWGLVLPIDDPHGGSGKMTIPNGCSVLIQPAEWNAKPGFPSKRLLITKPGAIRCAGSTPVDFKCNHE